MKSELLRPVIPAVAVIVPKIIEKLSTNESSHQPDNPHSVQAWKGN